MSELQLGQTIYVLHKEQIKAAKIYSICNRFTDANRTSTEVRIDVYIMGEGIRRLNEDIHVWATTSEALLDGIRQDIVEWQE